MYFFAFLGNVIDGPVMWLLTPPDGGWESSELIAMNKIALLPALIIVLRPWFWPALAACWILWHPMRMNGGQWFFFGWDQMIDEIGFLTCILSVTLTLYDDIEVESDGEAAVVEHVEEKKEEPSTQQWLLQEASAQKSEGHEEPAVHKEVAADAALRSRRSRQSPKQAIASSAFAWDILWTSTSPSKSSASFRKCSQVVDWCRILAELSMTLAAFRLFLAAGLLKMRRGSACWKTLTCLYDHYETQPMPNLLSWAFQNYTPQAMLSVMQWFAIDLCECIVPFFLLSFVLSMGPLGILHRQLLQRKEWFLRLPAKVPGRLLASVFIMIFVFGMFIGGNYAFLHPLAIVSLIASMSTVQGTAVIRKRESKPVMLYRSLMPWLLLPLLLFAFLPSLRAYAWLWSGQERLGFLEPLMQSGVVRYAESLNLGIPYNHHAYFAGAVHQRKEMVLLADVGDGFVEVDVPYKVGRVDRMPLQTSPLHRRFAWQWWFIGLGQDPSWLVNFMELLCNKNDIAWQAVEYNNKVHSQLHKLRRVAAQMYQYHFSKPGSAAWWERVELSRRQRIELSCK